MGCKLEVCSPVGDALIFIRFPRTLPELIMAATAAAYSSLISRVFSPLSILDGGKSASKPGLFMGPTNPALPTLRAPLLTVVFARRNKKNSAVTAKKETSLSKIKKSQPEVDGEEDDIDEDAIETLFSQLEEDLKNDLSDDGGDDEITEEDLAKLEQELEEAFGDIDFDELPGSLLPNSASKGGDDDSDEEERPPELKNWQAKRLAYALKIGRRKTSIKSLAAELGLDRAFVLELLRDPPPQLLLMSASLPDEVSQTTSTKPLESSPVSIDIVPENEPEVQEPVHVKQTRWSMQKRLKKVHVETLERVYSRTKRPTNAMISSIIHVTNLPWKRVVKWFEDKRIEDGVPDNRVPFRRSVPETTSTS